MSGPFGFLGDLGSGSCAHRLRHAPGFVHEPFKLFMVVILGLIWRKILRSLHVTVLFEGSFHLHQV